MRMVDDPDELAELFGRHPELHVYGLADLEEPIWGRSEWFRRGDAAVGIVDLGEGITTVYAVSAADPPGSVALVVDLLDHIPPGTMITGPRGLAAAVRARGGVDDLGIHVKCVLADVTRLPESAGTIPLGLADFDRLTALHATDPGAAFVLESMLADDTFVGLPDPADPSRLVAAAGTHVLSPTYAVAAIGAVFVEPSARGNGHGATVTAAVCDRLRGRVSTIGLNVQAGNLAARRTYAQLGFVDCLDYEEIVVNPERSGV